jgi:hypothetical protein
MTYLTLLEFQLTSENLPTLNRLLSEDDGTLAEEIGWDLLKLMLPLLNPNPDEANRGLEIVARRGNPREVVVRVAEELETLSDQVEDVEDLESAEELDRGHDHDDDHEALPTFDGEAPRVHLGAMTLDGMPEAGRPATNLPGTEERDDSTRSPIQSVKALKLQGLLKMLGILHPRIQTQYPSRFLATSLPAALAAYRRQPISTATTSAFLSMLEQLSGKKRPALPPRDSSAKVGASTAATAPAPLPDPEAKAEEEETGVKFPSEEEQAIIFRLLNAVTLEVWDEYMSSLASSAHPSMSWTARLRERLDPRRVVPGRPTETQLWARVEDLKDRDALMARFYSLAQVLDLHAGPEIKKVVHDEEDPEDPSQGKEEEAVSEYPTSPAQIPLPIAGVIYLHAYESHLEAEAAGDDRTPLLSETELTKLIAHAFPLSATPLVPSPTLLDALLSLLYRHTVVAGSAAAAAGADAADPSPPPSPAKFMLLLSTLTQVFTITPWPSLRDSAHRVATGLVHAHPDAGLRVRVIAQTLRGRTLSTNWAEIEDDEPDPHPGIDEETGLTRSTSALQPHPIPLAPPPQVPALKAVGVDWLKDEFAAWIRGGGSGSDQVRGLDPGILTAEIQPRDDSADVDSLVDLLFPQNLPVLPDVQQDSPDPLSVFLQDMPFFIATLNLVCVVLPHLDASAELGGRIAAHVRSLDASSQFLLQVLQHAASAPTSENGDLEGILEESRPDIVALQDACTRAGETLERTGTA